MGWKNQSAFPSVHVPKCLIRLKNSFGHITWIWKPCPQYFFINYVHSDLVVLIGTIAHEIPHSSEAEVFLSVLPLTFSPVSDVVGVLAGGNILYVTKSSRALLEGIDGCSHVHW